MSLSAGTRGTVLGLALLLGAWVPLTVVSDRPPLVLHPRLLRWGFYDRTDRYDKYGFGHFLEGEDLPRRAWYASDLFRHLPGVHVIPTGRRDYSVRCRGGSRWPSTSTVRPSVPEAPTR